MGYTIPDGVTVDRTYAGRHQKAEGASSWLLPAFSADGSENGRVFSSQWSVTEVVKKGFTIHQNKYSGDYHLYPND